MEDELGRYMISFALSTLIVVAIVCIYYGLPPSQYWFIPLLSAVFMDAGVCLVYMISEKKS